MRPPTGYFAERSEQAEAIFHTALNLPADERDALVAEACAEDESLEAEVGRLLAAHHEAGDFMDGPLAPEVEDTLARLKREEEGDLVGRYKLLQEIGEGGFGTVWMAEQTEPMVRKVALKIIKIGMDTKEVIGRFEAERQALAMMDHPHIAKVLDAGATEYGRPYFVMELVKGIPITTFCDEQRLGTPERLELFRDVCAAVNHAHQKGIIHRDLKPSNVMVTLHGTKPVVKVIDFGIAKATQGKLTDKTLFTRYEQFIGTPVYMSPEQAVMSGLDIDTRSDIYSLGILLYELLTGRPPFDSETLASAGYDEMRRIIREVEPPRPSSRLSTVVGDERTQLARTHHVEPERLARLVEADLDWIVMKAIDKDRTRRYETANALSMDIGRFLAHEAVLATPPSAGYKFRKFARRNRAALRVAAAILLLLIASTIVSSLLAVRAMRAEQLANSTIDELRATAPAFMAEARALVERDRFDEALVKIDYALTLASGEPDYLLTKANLLQSKLRLDEAAGAYRAVLARAPGHETAAANLELTEQLLAEGPADGSKWSSQQLARLYLRMQEEGRAAAEIYPIALEMDKQGELLLDYWKARLRDLPIGAERPLDERLTMAPTGRFVFDLSGTAVSDLSPLEGMPLGWLDLRGCALVTDLEPIAHAPLRTLWLGGASELDNDDMQVLSTLEDLVQLDLSGTQVEYLIPLRDLPLRRLGLNSTRVFNLSPLEDMELDHLDLRFSRVASLAPLEGMPLTHLDVTSIPATDFEVLGGMPLEELMLQRVRAVDLSFLEGMPLRTLSLWGSNDARNYAALTTLDQLESLILPSSAASLPEEDLRAIDSLKDLPRLTQIADEIMDGMMVSTAGAKEDFLLTWQRRRGLQQRLNDAGIEYSMWTVSPDTIGLKITSPTFDDCSLLKGFPIEVLTLGSTAVTDLSPLRGMPLKELYLWWSLVADLDPIDGMPLETLHLAGTPVVDLSPVRGLPLKYLKLHDCRHLVDLRPLADCPELLEVTLPPNAEDYEFLRTLPALERLSFGRDPDTDQPTLTASQFWRSRGEDPWLRSLLESRFPIDKPEDDPRNAGLLSGLYAWYERAEEREELCERLARWAEDTEDPDDAETVAQMVSLAEVGDRKLRKAALALARTATSGAAEAGKEGPWYHLTLGMAEYREGNLSDACAALDVATRLLHQTGSDAERARVEGIAGFYLTMALQRLGKAPSAREVFERTEAFMTPLPEPGREHTDNRPHQDDLFLWLAYREAASMLEIDPFRPDKPLEILAQQAREHPQDSMHPLKLATLQLWLGRTDGYVRTSRRMIERAEREPQDKWAIERAAKVFFLTAPGMHKIDPERAMAVVRKAGGTEIEPGRRPWYMLALGTAEYRMGDLGASAEAFLDAEESLVHPDFPLWAQYWVRGTSELYRAMILHRQGEASAARKLFVAASAAMRPVPRDREDVLASGSVPDQDQLIYWMAHLEAAELLGMEPSIVKSR